MRDERLVETIHVDQRDRLCVYSDLRPCKCLGKLVECANPAGKNGDAVSKVKHARLAFVHRVNDVQLGQVRMRDFTMTKRAGKYANHVAASRNCGVSQYAHQPAGRSAIHDTDPLASQPCLLYTSDAADDLLCVDLGGRRII